MSDWPAAPDHSSSTASAKPDASFVSSYRVYPCGFHDEPHDGAAQHHHTDSLDQGRTEHQDQKTPPLGEMTAIVAHRRSRRARISSFSWC